MAIFSEKTIILGVPRHYDIDKVIAHELKALGFRIINISFYNNQYKYKNGWERIECFFMKNILWKRNYKSKIAFKANEKWISKELEAIDVADYALMIRPEVYPLDFIESLHKKANKVVGYQWDGLSRFPQIYQYIPLFDRFFVFTGKDLNYPSVLPITNYYPNAVEKNQLNPAAKSDVFYSGYFIKERVNTLSKIVRDCKALGKKVNCHIFLRKKTQQNQTSFGLEITDKPLSYEESIQFTLNTSTVLDLVSPAHEGLSFRVFEAIGFEKKLITTNKKIKDYDFYNPNNILIWDETTVVELEAFLSKPYTSLPTAIKEKYSFKNWIQYALDEGNYTEIKIPN